MPIMCSYLRRRILDREEFVFVLDALLNENDITVNEIFWASSFRCQLHPYQALALTQTLIVKDYMDLYH